MRSKPLPVRDAGVWAPFNKPFVASGSLAAVGEALAGRRLGSGGPFARRCESWLERATGGSRALLTQSCSAGLEAAVALAGVGPGDEVVMPSFNFPSVASALVGRGGVPVFVDVRGDTLNIDEAQVEQAIGPKTRAIVCVDYGGVASELDALQATADRHSILLIEDAAHAFQSTYRGRPVGCHAGIVVFSFHDTKDVTSGEGGALIVNRRELLERAAVIADKGTNLRAFLNGEVESYSWVEAGQSLRPSEITASFLWAQLQQAGRIREARIAAWHAYDAALAGLEARGLLRRQIVPPHCGINGNACFVLLAEGAPRGRVIAALKGRGIETAFHFVPLHSAPAGRRHGRTLGVLSNTESVARRILRLPLWPGIEPHCREIVDALGDVLAGS